MAIEGDFLMDYQEFVDEVSSDATRNINNSFTDALDIVDEQGVEPSRLLLGLDYLVRLVSLTTLLKNVYSKVKS